MSLICPDLIKIKINLLSNFNQNRNQNVLLQFSKDAEYKISLKTILWLSQRYN